MKRWIVYLLLVAFAAQPVFAEVKKVGFQNRHTLRITARSDDDDYDLYLTRVSAYIDYNIPQIDRVVKISPFVEYQSNLDTNTWWRKEVGVELGSSFFNDCFYWGSSFQHVWQKQENYPVELLAETTEWESRFVITPPIPWGMFKDKEKLKLSLVEEYTYDFTRGQATFNEVAIVLDWQLFPGLRLPISWRHVDRVHDFDSDSLEVSLLFSF